MVINVLSCKYSHCAKHQFTGFNTDTLKHTTLVKMVEIASHCFYTSLLPTILFHPVNQQLLFHWIKKNVFIELGKCHFSLPFLFAITTANVDGRKAENCTPKLLTLNIFWVRIPSGRVALPPPWLLQPPTLLWVDTYAKFYWNPWISAKWSLLSLLLSFHLCTVLCFKTNCTKKLIVYCLNALKKNMQRLKSTGTHPVNVCLYMMVNVHKQAKQESTGGQ